MNLQNYKSSEEIVLLIEALLNLLHEGNGEAAFKLSLVFSPWSTLRSDIKKLIGASESRRRHYRNLALRLLEKAPVDDLEAQSILEILRKEGMPGSREFGNETNTEIQP